MSGRRLEKVQDEFIALWRQAEPVDNAGEAGMVAANEEANDDDEPLESGLTRKAWA